MNIDNITIYFPYYNQSKALHLQIDNFLNYESNILNKILLLIVDDGSMIEPAINYIHYKNFSNLIKLKLIRINEDIKWNTPEANNIAFHEADTKLILRLDIDHIITYDNFIKLIKLKLDLSKNEYYIFNRIYNNKIINNGKNIYLITKKNFNLTDGYNEYFSGNYGDDLDFIPRLDKCCKKQLLENIYLHVNINLGTKNLVRNTDINKEKLLDEKRPFLKYVHKSNYILLFKNYNIHKKFKLH